MEAIIYTSNTGFTEKYANLLGQATGLPVYSLKNAGKLNKGASVIYMGWLMAGGIKGFKKASRRFNVSAVCAVGMGAPEEQPSKEVAKRYGSGGMQVFVLQGGFDMNKLSGMNKLAMKMVVKSVISGIEKKPEKSPEDMEMLEMYTNGFDRVSLENLVPVIEWYKAQIV
ncbi:MAG: flavodoxin domain-containing protein [Oscillospiraceae bacterium]|jgi:hypothetical protein